MLSKTTDETLVSRCACFNPRSLDGGADAHAPLFSDLPLCPTLEKGVGTEADETSSNCGSTDVFRRAAI
jgi:hypothetical protein